MDDIVINTVTGEFQINKKMVEHLYISKSDLRKLVERMRNVAGLLAASDATSHTYAAATTQDFGDAVDYWANELEAVLNKEVGE